MAEPVVNVEKIMEEIRREIQMEEALRDLPRFEDIPLDGGERPAPAGTPAPAAGNVDWPLLAQSLDYLNRNYDIPYYWTFYGSKVKTFLKRVVRRLAKCILAPIVSMQDAFNAHVVRVCNNLKEAVVALMARADAHQGELAQLRGELDELRRALERQQTLLAQQKLTLEEQRAALAQQDQVCEKRLDELVERMEAQEQAAIQRDETLAAIQQEQTCVEEAEEHLERWQEDRDLKLAAIARDTIRTKWRLTDYLDAERDDPDEVVRCGICGHAEPKSHLKTMESRCIFDGGELIRYVCPSCGAVFGPTKFSRQSEEQFDDDYTVHYTGYHEGDSTRKERHAFMLLHPSKTGIYLNYGCGSWSKTMRELREEGYQVYGYEPYSKDIDNPYIISDKERLKHMRFDGIFSNDLLEHLVDPVGELLFMRSLLAKPSSLMSHCTGCYRYKYEYTRFHMFFFTGSSMEYICQQTGLIVAEEVEDEAEDFLCKVFKMRDTVIDLLPDMLIQTSALRENEGIRIEPDGIVCGPYLTMPPGAYHMEIDLQLPEETATQEMNLTADSGQTHLRSFELRQGKNIIDFDLPKQCEQLEFVFQNTLDQAMWIRTITLV